MNSGSLNRERVARTVRAMPALFGIGNNGKCLTESPDIEEVSWRDLLHDYYRVMEIAHYLRRGGVKAMKYRIETGKTKFVPSDYFDEAHQNLSASFRDLYVPERGQQQSILDRLNKVSEEEEESVREFLSDIDKLLLAGNRQALTTEEFQ